MHVMLTVDVSSLCGDARAGCRKPASDVGSDAGLRDAL